MSLSIQHLTSLKSLEIRGCKEIDLFSDDGTQCVSVITLLSFIISKVPCLITLHHFKYNQYASASLDIFKALYKQLKGCKGIMGGLPKIAHVDEPNSSNFQEREHATGTTALNAKAIES